MISFILAGGFCFLGAAAPLGVVNQHNSVIKDVTFVPLTPRASGGVGVAPVQVGAEPRPPQQTGLGGFSDSFLLLPANQ